MKLIKNILRTIKFYALYFNYRLFYLKKNNGYNNLTLNKSIIKKTIKFSNFNSINEQDTNIQRTIKFLKFIKKKKLNNIIDFGGGAGYHYLIAKIKLPNFNCRWQVIENKTMVRLCNKAFKYKNLFFFNSLNNIKKNDILFSSCSINYTKNPLKTLKMISKLDSKYLYFTRTPLTQNKSIEFKQISLLSDNGPCKLKNEKKMLIEYKNKIIKKECFENIFKNKYTILSRYIDQKNAFCYGNNSFDTYTYIFKRRIN
jgi:putative methyltransferase (TIGR04325 family)